MADLEALMPMMRGVDRAIVEAAVADRDGRLTLEHIDAIIHAWVNTDPAVQATKLRYFRSNRPYGAKLRASLDMAAHIGMDLGAMQADLDAMKGRPWP